MADIRYSLGGTEFDAVPETLDDSMDVPVKSEATLGRGLVHSVGVEREKIVLVGKYMSVAVKNAIAALCEACGNTGATAVLDDGYVERDVLVRSFEVTPIVGKTEGYGFRIEMVAV